MKIKILASCLGTLCALHAAQANDNIPDPTFGDGGTAYLVPGANQKFIGNFPVALIHDSHVYVLDEVEEGGDYFSRITRLDRNGDVSQDYGTNGHVDLRGLDGLYDDYSWSNGLFDSNGDLYLAGYAEVGDNADMFVCRVTPAGTLDTAWGGKDTGCTTIAFDLEAGGFDRAHALAIQSNGRLLVAGSAAAGGHYSAAIARLNTLGLTDNSLGGGTGAVTIGIPGWSSFASAGIALDSAQRIIVGGNLTESLNPANVCDEDFGVARLLPNGDLDLTFGAFPISWDLGPIVDNCGLTADGIVSGGVTAFPDDSILLVGQAQFADYGRAIAAVKITTNAEADSSFGGGDGMMHRYICDVCSTSYVSSSAIQDDGKIVVVGATFVPGFDEENPGSYDTFVARLLPDGGDDVDFDGGGAIYLDYSFDGNETDENPGVVAVEPHRIVVPGITETVSQNPDIKIRRPFVTALGDLPPVLIFSDGLE